MKIEEYSYEFVEFIPKDIEDGKLYISIPYKVMKHKCACGCGEDVVLPIDSISGWELTFNGDSISVEPSIGNWDLKCQSHYYIKKNRTVEVLSWGKKHKKKKIKWKFWK